MGIEFPQCLWGILEITAIPATIVGMLQYERPKIYENSQSNPKKRYIIYFRNRLAANNISNEILLALG